MIDSLLRTALPALLAAVAALALDPGVVARRRLTRAAVLRPAGHPGGPVRGRVARLRPRRGGRDPEPMPVALVVDLVAAVLDAGGSVPGALGVVGEVLTGHGDSRGAELSAAAASAPATAPAAPGAAPAWSDALFQALELSQRTGSGPVGLVTAAAEESRRRHAEARQVATARLAVLVVLPVGLCLLPAFVLLAVVPLVLTLLAG